MKSEAGEWRSEAWWKVRWRRTSIRDGRIELSEAKQYRTLSIVAYGKKLMFDLAFFLSDDRREGTRLVRKK